MPSILDEEKVMDARSSPTIETVAPRLNSLFERKDYAQLSPFSLNLGEERPLFADANLVKLGVHMKKLPLAIKLALGLLALSFVPTFVLAEDAAPKDKKPSKATLEKYDSNKDGQLSDEEKANAKEVAKEKAKHTREETLAKYDANKDGKLEDTEKAAKKADEETAKAEKKAEKEAAKIAKSTEGK